MKYQMRMVRNFNQVLLKTSALSTLEKIEIERLHAANST